MKKLCALTLGLLFSLGSIAVLYAAPQFGSNRGQGQGRDRVCFYQDIQFRGWEQCYNVGDEVSDLGGRKKSISSIRVFGRAHVTVYEDPEFDGRSSDFNSDVADLGLRSIAGSKSWNDQIESIRIESDYGVRDSRNAPPVFGRNTPPARGRNQNQAGICVYDRRDFQGREECFRSGADVRDLARQGNWSDRISSIRILGNATAVLYRDIDFRGESIVIDRDIADLRDIRSRGFGGWDRQVSSLAVDTTNRARRFR